MKIDIVEQIGAVTRKIISRDYNGKPARVLIATRSYDTTPEDLWDALTNSDRLARWFLPISGELKLGGHYQFEGNAGGEITICEPPNHLAVTWGMHGQTSWVDITLSKEVNGRIELRLEHIAHIPEEMWNQFGPGAVGIGWEQSLLGLGLHLSKDETVDPTTIAAWSGSDEGKKFVRQSSDAWCDASIESGTDADLARAGAIRATAFYTPSDED